MNHSSKAIRSFWVFGLALIGLVLLSPVAVRAQTDPKTQKPTNEIKYQNVEGSIRAFLCTPDQGPANVVMYTCINKLFRFGIVTGGFVLVFLVVMAAYFYLAGGEASKAKGKEIISSSLVGLAMLLLSYTLLKFINPYLVDFRIIQPPIFKADNAPAQTTDRVPVSPGGGTGSVNNSGGAVSGSSLKDKSVYLFGDSLTENFGNALKKQVAAKNWTIEGCGNSSIKHWLDGNFNCNGGGITTTPRIRDRLAQFTDTNKPDVVLIMLGTNGIKNIQSGQVKEMDNILASYETIWIAPPKFPQPSCYGIDELVSTTANDVIANNFTGSNHSVFKSAEKTIGLQTDYYNDCTKAVQNKQGAGYDIHPKKNDTSWAKAFAGS